MRARLYLLLVVALLAAVALSLLVGRADLSDDALRDALLQLRGGRLAAAFLTGAALAAGGVLVQGLFRNPLASPSVLGTTAGANLGGQLALLAAGVLLPGSASPALRGTALVGRELLAPELLVPLGCLLGAVASLLVLLAFLRVTHDLLALLLVGFILSSLFLSVGSFVTSVAQERWELGRAVVAFSLGTVSGVGPRDLALAAPLVVGGVVAGWVWGRPLDLLLSGEDEARAMGVDVRQVRAWVVVWVSALVAGAVSLGGGVSFVGLVVPHALRPFTGASHRALLPAAALAGGTFVVLADLIARSVPAQGEVPLGVVTGLVGAPLFLLLLVRARRESFDG